MKRKQIRRKSRKFGFEQLESRDLLTTVITNEVRVFYNSTITNEQGAAIAIVVDLRRAPSSDVTFPVYSTNTAERAEKESGKGVRNQIMAFHP
jgi:hypothetical protein